MYRNSGFDIGCLASADVGDLKLDEVCTDISAYSQHFECELPPTKISTLMHLPTSANSE